jgi:hypothetical protein
MSGPVQSDFIVGQMQGLSNTQYLTYSNAVFIFHKVEAYNLNVSTLRSAGKKTLPYYAFDSTTEQASYTQGMFLLFQNDPVNAAAGKYNPVPKN